MNGSLGTMPLAPKIVATATQQDQKNYKLMRAATPFLQSIYIVQKSTNPVALYNIGLNSLTT